MKLAFVCVRNAGRSQMATAFAEREREERGLDWEIVSGGTDPAERVHEEVVDAMREAGIGLSDRTPRAVDEAELRTCDRVVTMGCSTLSLSGDVAVRDWALEDPHGKSPEAVRAVRDEVERRVVALFDELGTDEARGRLVSTRPCHVRTLLVPGLETVRRDEPPRSAASARLRLGPRPGRVLPGEHPRRG